MASTDTCPESKKKKLYNVFSNATAEMLESHYGITVPDNIKNYRVVIQYFTPQLAIIGADNITKGSTFIFYDPDQNNKRDQNNNIIFYNAKGEIIESIKVKHISDIAYCKKLKIAKDKAYEEKAIPAKYSKDILEKETGSSSQDKLIISKKGKKAHHIKGYENTYYCKYSTAVAEFIGITLFNAALKKVGLYEYTTEYTLVRDESGKVYFDSTDARDDSSWEYIEYLRDIEAGDIRLVPEIEHKECMTFNLLKSTIIASALGADDRSMFYDYCWGQPDKGIYTHNILKFLDDKNSYHVKHIDLNNILFSIFYDKMFFLKDNLIDAWYCGYLCNEEKFNSIECKDVILDAFRSIIEVDFLGELEAIKPILGIAGDSFDIEEISKKITSHIDIICKDIIEFTNPKIYCASLDKWVAFCENTNFNAEVVKLAEELKDKYDEKQAVYRETALFVYAREWMDFCENTNCNAEVVKLSEELKHKYAEKQATYLAAATESETIDTTSLEMYYEQGSQQI